MTMSKVCDMPLEYNGVSSEKYHPPKPFRWQLITKQSTILNRNYVP